MKRTLIVFGTRRGTTETTAQVLAETLILKHGHQVDLFNIRFRRKIRRVLDEADNIIAGSSIVSGRWKPGVLRFLKNNTFPGKKVAVFVTAGVTMNRMVMHEITKEEAAKEAIRNYIDRYEDKFHFELVSKAAFGGLVKRMGRETFNSWNREDIESWAISLGKIFM
jgi:menaquinone-dependent protoporphyrinogen IX oxidase